MHSHHLFTVPSKSAKYSWKKPNCTNMSRHLFSLSLSILMAIFQVKWVSPCLLKQRMMEVVVITEATSCAKLQSNHHQQTNTKLFTGRMPFLLPNQHCQSTEWKISHSMDLLTPSSLGGLPTLSLTTNSSWLPGGGLPCLSSAFWCQYPNNQAFLIKVNRFCFIQLIKFQLKMLQTFWVFLMIHIHAQMGPRPRA